MRYLLAAAIIIWAVQVNAVQYHKDDFAFGYNLEVDGSGAIYSVALTRDIYSSLVQTGLGDIRIFNSKGEVVPHEIRIAEVERDYLTTAVDIPVFALSSEKGGSGDDLSVVIKRNKTGNIISLRDSRNDASKVVSYLLDLDEAGSYPLKLRLEWQAKVSFMVPVRLESSHDLIKWHRVTGGTLADLEFMGNKLQHKELTLEKKLGRYLRIIFADGKAISITGVKAVSGPQPLPTLREWVTTPLSRKEENGVTFLEARVEGAFLIDSLQIKFPQDNSILLARLHSRVKPGASWRYYGEKLFYSLLENEVELHSEPLMIPPSNNKSYRLEVLQDGAGLVEMVPELELGYIPHELIFMARGEAPFILAFGNGSMNQEVSQNGGTILQGLTDKKGKSLVRSAALSDRFVLAGETALGIRAVLPWKRIILWLILIIGVAVLGGMVWSLSRKMR